MSKAIEESINIAEQEAKFISEINAHKAAITKLQSELEKFRATNNEKRKRITINFWLPERSIAYQVSNICGFKDKGFHVSKYNKEKIRISFNTYTLMLYTDQGIEVILPATNEYCDYRVTSLTFKNNNQRDAILNLIINSITKELFDNAVEPSRFSPFPEFVTYTWDTHPTVMRLK